MQWAHVTCIGEKKDYGGVWSCFQCRQMSKHVLTLLGDSRMTMNELANAKQIVTTPKTTVDRLQATADNLTAELITLKETNCDLVKRVDMLQSGNIAIKAKLNCHEQANPETLENKKRSLVICFPCLGTLKLKTTP